MNKNKHRDMNPFDMAEKPAMPYPFLMPLVWAGSYIMTRPFGLKIQKKNMRGLKPPYLIIGTHQGFSDYYIGPLATFPYRTLYVSDMEGFANFGKWLYRGLGCIGKRRYVPEIHVLKHMRYALAKGHSVMLFPESRHSNVGTTAYVPDNLGRLAKFMDVPVVMLTAKGSYLANPFWDEEHTRKVPMRATMTCVYSVKELRETSAEAVQKTIETYLLYDEYRYQQENHIRIRDKKRAEGLHKALYQCRSCGTKYKMTSAGAYIQCKSCGRKWELTEDGWLQEQRENSGEEAEKIHIPAWYEWQREGVIASLTHDFHRRFEVRVEALPSEKGFVDMGTGSLWMDRDAFVLKFGQEELHFPHKLRESVQTEYNYRGKGMCVVLSTKDCCYYVYCDDETFNPTELQFAGEYLYQKKRGIL